MIQLVVVFTVLASSAAKPWPKKYDAPKAHWSKEAVDKGHNYRTKSYLIISNREIEKSKLSEIATMAESVCRVLELFPLAFLPDNDRQASKIHVVRIFAEETEYIASGTPKGTIGYFDGRSGEVKVSLERLLETQSPSSNLQPRQRYRLLVHELVHQAMGSRFHALPPWLSEGLAEYFSALQFAPGRYRFTNCSRQIIDHLRTIWIHDQRNTITVPTLDILTQMTANSWAKDTQSNKNNSYAKYAGSLLLTHYQMELASRNLGRLPEFLKSAQISFEEVRGHQGQYRALFPSQAILWEKRPLETVENQIVKYWKAKGLNIRFATKP